MFAIAPMYKNIICKNRSLTTFVVQSQLTTGREIGIRIYLFFNSFFSSFASNSFDFVLK